MSDGKAGQALGQPRDQHNEHAREPYVTPASRRAAGLGAWLSESLRSDLVEFPWLAAALQATGSPLVSATHSSLASSSGTDADSLGTLSSVADSLASTASTVSFTSTVCSRTLEQGQGGQCQPAYGTLGAGPEFSWESSYRHSRLPAAWPSAPGSAPWPAARSHGHISSASRAPGSAREMERSSQVGPMTKREATGARSSSSLSQAQWTAAQTPQSRGHGRQRRHQPYARPEPSNTSRLPFEASSFDDLKSFHHVDSVAEAAAVAPAASGAAWSAAAARRPDARSDCDDGDLTLGPGAPPGWVV